MEEDEIWRAETIRVGNVEMSVLLEIDSGKLIPDTEHLVLLDPTENVLYAAYGAQDIYMFLSTMNSPEKQMWESNAKKVVEYALSANWI